VIVGIALYAGGAFYKRLASLEPRASAALG
jgi:hypothetical protein